MLFARNLSGMSCCIRNSEPRGCNSSWRRCPALLESSLPQTLWLHVYKYYLHWAPMSINSTYIWPIWSPRAWATFDRYLYAASAKSRAKVNHPRGSSAAFGYIGYIVCIHVYIYIYIYFWGYIGIMENKMDIAIMG